MKPDLVKDPMSRRLVIKRPRTALLQSISACSLLLCAPDAAAQDAAFNVETFEPGGASSVLGVDSSHVPNHLKSSADVTVHRSEAPVVFRSSGTTEAIDDRWTLDLGLGLGLWEEFQFDARLPLITAQGGVGVRGQLQTLAAGDLRLRGKWRLLESGLQNPVGLAVQAALYVPTGDRSGFASDGVARFEPKIIADIHLGPVAMLLNAGYQVRGKRFIGAYRHDDVIRWGVAARLPLPARFDVEASIFGEHSLLAANVEGDATPNKFAHPIETLGGIGWTIGDVRVGLAAGAGITKGVGAPAYRLVFSLGYEPARRDEDEIAGRTVKAHDFDEDGFAGDADRCPYEAETFDGFEDLDGCPDLDDDGDQVADTQDLCPLQPGLVAKSGCPLSDVDSDGIDDAQDACPGLAGPPDGDGCPTPRESQQWRDQFAVVTADCAPSAPGCSTVDVEEQFPEAVFFKTGRDQFRPVENPLVERVGNRMLADDSVVKLIVEGHTDDTGDTEANRALARNRAETVRDVLADKGVSIERIEVRAFGEDLPLDTNDTEEGRARNRRVVFRMVIRQRGRQVEIDDVASEVEIPTLSLADFDFDRRHLVGFDPARFVEGTVLKAPAGWKCATGSDVGAEVVTVLAQNPPVSRGRQYPGWQEDQTLSCRRGHDIAEFPIGVEIPPFGVYGIDEGVRVTTRRPTQIDIRFAGRSIPLTAVAEGYRVEQVGMSADGVRLNLMGRPAEPAAAARIGASNRTLLNLPLLPSDDAVAIEAVPQQRRVAELGGGSTFTFAGKALTESGRAASAAISGLRVTLRTLATNWFSLGAIADVGSALGDDPIVFTPAVGAEATFHAPLSQFRPFFSNGLQAWFPALEGARPAWESAVGIDWEPAAGVGLRAAGRAVLMTKDSTLIVLPGGFLGVFTTF